MHDVTGCNTLIEGELDWQVHHCCVVVVECPKLQLCGWAMICWSDSNLAASMAPG